MQDDSEITEVAHEVAAPVEEYPEPAADYKDEGGVEMGGVPPVDKPKPKWKMRGPNLKLSEEIKAEIIRQVNEEKKSAKSVARAMNLPPTSCYRIAGQARGDEKHMPRPKKEKIVVEGAEGAVEKPPRKKRVSKKRAAAEEDEEEEDEEDNYKYKRDDYDNETYDADGPEIEQSVSFNGRPRTIKKYRDDY